MREREREVLLMTVNAVSPESMLRRLIWPFDFIKALAQVALDQEKRIETLERDKEEPPARGNLFQQPIREN